jgi:hypothetical protein
MVAVISAQKIPVYGIGNWKKYLINKTHLKIWKQTEKNNWCKLGFLNVTEKAFETLAMWAA